MACSAAIDGTAERQLRRAGGHWGYEGSAEPRTTRPARRDVPDAPEEPGDARPQPRRRGHRPRRRRAGHDEPRRGEPPQRPHACSTRAASSRSSSATSPATRRRWSSQVCGCTPEELIRVAELLCANSGRERTSAIVYALGWTQHTTGVQMIRTAGILQLLLGNMGRPGGGIMAMRGHSTHPGLDRPARRSTTCCPATCRSRPPTRQHETLDSTSSTRACPPATGPTSASSSSACSRPGTATPRRRRTTSASPGCRASMPTTRSCPTSTAWRRAR